MQSEILKTVGLLEKSSSIRLPYKLSLTLKILKTFLNIQIN